MRYGTFAWWYERYWSRQALWWQLEILEPVLDGLPGGAAVLEVGCGPGHLLAALAERGFTVSGIDVTPEFVAMARERIPEADVEALDVRSLSRPRQFDAAVAMYGTCNHLLTPDDLRSGLAAVAGALRPGAPFVLDLNTREGIASWEGAHVEDGDAVFSVEPEVDPRSRRARLRVRGRRRSDSGIEPLDATLEQAWYEEAEVREALEVAGLTAVTCADAADLAPGHPRGRRAVFTARAP